MDSLHLPTFRDPAGSVTVLPDSVVRRIRPAYAADALELLNHPAVATLTAEGKLIGAAVVPEGGDELVLRHPRIPFISYPWEWSPALLVAAADLTLDLCAELIPHGFILKDATPLNVLFNGSTPIFIDLLSIERHAPGDSLWLAYGQFLRTFVLPLLAHSHLGWPLAATQLRRDGFEPEEIFAALPWSRRLQRPAWSTVTLPVLLSRFSTPSKAAPGGEVAKAQSLASRIQTPEIVQRVLLSRIEGLRAAVHRAAPAATRSTWSDYAVTAAHYSGEDHDSKRRFVQEVLAQTKPQNVLDVGCNTGNYSRLAVQAGASVVALDSDLQALDRLAVQARAENAPILPLHIDLAHPTPASGWNNREAISFLDRAEDHFDLVLMLAVIHHLLLSSQIPLPHIAELVQRLTREHLVIEWVPETDPKFRELLRGRDSLYTHLNEAAFREAFAPHFSIARELRLDNGRTLFHMVRR